MDDDDYLEFDEQTGTYKNVQVDDSFIAIENHPEFINVHLKLPTFDLEAARRGLKQVIVLKLHKWEIDEMRLRISKYEEIVCYTDGCSLNNPGLSGAGVVFAGRNLQAKGIQKFGKISLGQNEEFLFGLTLHLGTCSNNYAEYSAFILAQLFNTLFGITTTTINADS